MLVVLLGLALHAQGALVGSPVERVVKLLEQLKTNIATDGASEQKTYNKYACWCETTSARKATAIDTAKEDIRTLSNEILGLRGARSGLGSDIEQLALSVQENEESAQSLTHLRQQTATDNSQERQKMEQTVGALETAMKLVRSGYSLAAATAKISKVDPVLAESVAEKVSNITTHPVLRSFLQDHNNLVKANAKYAPMSQDILNILTALHATFIANMDSAIATESSAKTTFTSVLAGKTGSLAAFRQTLKSKETENSQKGQEMAQKEQLLLDTNDQMEDDKAFFATTVQECEDESTAWDERSRRRTEETTGIDQALEILTDDDTRANFGSAFSFVQFALKNRKPLAAVAEKVKAKQEPEPFDAGAHVAAAFGPVTEGIDNMVQELKDEEAKDIRQRDFCIFDQNNYTDRKENLEHNIDILNEKIAKLEKENSDIEADLTKTDNKLTELAQAVTDASALRAEETAAYTLGRSQDIDAQTTLNSTLDALNAFYDNNAIDKSLKGMAGSPITQLQIEPPQHMLRQDVKLKKQTANGASSKYTVIHGAPEFEIHEDDAPATVATDETYEGRQGETKAILSLLADLVEQLQTEVSKDDIHETEATDSHTNFLNISETTRETLETTKTNLDASNTANLGFIQGHEAVRTTTEGELQATNDYLLRIFPNCNWIKSSFELRLSRRASETTGLLDAKSLLSGGELVSAVAVKAVVKAAHKELNIKTASADELVASLDDDAKHWAAKARIAQLVARHDMFKTVIAPHKKHGARKPGVPSDDVATAAKAKPAHVVKKVDESDASILGTKAQRAASEAKVAAVEKMFETQKRSGLRGA